MPEGDTIHRHAADFAATLLGQSVDAVWVRGIAQPALAGRAVDRTEAVGKNLLLGFGDVTLRVHLGIVGRWYRMPRSQLTAAKAARAHVAIVAGTRAWVCVKARAAELLRTAFVPSHRPIATLGPDLLADDFDLDTALGRAAPVAGRPAGEVLLDQRIAAGIGNIYKCEACFLERVDPFSPVDAPTLGRLLSRARSLMQKSVGRGERGRHWVYGRAGRPCYVCGTAIVSRVQGENVRPTYSCPRCQPAA